METPEKREPSAEIKGLSLKGMISFENLWASLWFGAVVVGLILPGEVGRVDGRATDTDLHI